MACSITCRVCGKKFSTRANTVRHMKTYHTTFRAFACPYCNRSFKHKCHLKDHLEKCRSAQKWKKKFCCWYTKSFITLLFVEQTPNGSSVTKSCYSWWWSKKCNALLFYLILKNKNHLFCSTFFSLILV